MKISVIIPLHNKGKYIAETLASVREQTFSDWETIVVENYSTDNGPDVVRSIEAIDDRIQLVGAPAEVRGPGAARNFGISIAQGDWILFLDADDLIENHYLKNMLSAAEENPDATIIATPWKIFDDRNDENQITFQLKEPAGYKQKGKGLLDYAIGYTCWATHAAIIRRLWLQGDRVWPVELDKYLAEDTAFWFRAVLNATVVYCPYSGALYRSQTPGCRTNYSPEAWFQGNHNTIKSNLAFIASRGLVPSLQQKANLVRAYSNLYNKALLAGNKTIADKSLIEAERWLELMYEESFWLGRHMWLRKLLGIGLYEKLKATVLIT